MTLFYTGWFIIVVWMVGSLGIKAILKITK